MRGVRGAPAWPRPRTASTSGVRAASRRADCHGVPAARARLPAVRPPDDGQIARGRLHARVRTGGGRCRCSADGRLSAHQAPGARGDARRLRTSNVSRRGHRVRDGTLARSSFRVYMRTVQKRFEGLLAEGAASHPRTSKTCAMRLLRRHALWTFVYIEGVEPTSNGAEQVVRHGVIMRKISYGTHSTAGSRFVERMLTKRLPAVECVP